MRNLLERAIWTFLETAISTFIGIELVFDVESLFAAVAAAAMAGGAAVLSAIKTYAQARLAE